MFLKNVEAKKEDAIVPNVESRVTVYIWHPKIDDEPASAKGVIRAVHKAHAANEWADVNIGHVAMSTPNKYISLWPGEKAKNKFRVVEAAYRENHVDDIDAEDGPPDLIVCLYSLDTKKMEHEFDNIQCSNQGFVLAGDKLIVRSQNERKGQNCNGIVYDLLVIGGIDKLATYSDRTNFSDYISPEKFFTFMKAVKTRELKAYPITKTFITLKEEFVPSAEECSTSDNSCK